MSVCARAGRSGVLWRLACLKCVQAVAALEAQ